MKRLNEFIKNFIFSAKLRRIRREVLLILASIMVFMTTYALILPALTIEKQEAADMPGFDAKNAEATISDKAATDEKATADGNVILLEETGDGEETLSAEEEEIFDESSSTDGSFAVGMGTDVIESADDWLDGGLFEDEETEDLTEGESGFDDWVIAEELSENFSDDSDAAADDDVPSDDSQAETVIGQEVAAETQEAAAGTQENAAETVLVGIGADVGALSVEEMSEAATAEVGEDISESAEDIPDTEITEKDVVEIETETNTETGVFLSQPEVVYKAGELSFDGTDYFVRLSYTKEAQIPAGAYLSVRELVAGSQEYEDCLLAAKAAMGLESDETLSGDQARFFDITILAESERNEENSENAGPAGNEESEENFTENSNNLEAEQVEESLLEQGEAKDQKAEKISRKIEPKAPVSVQISFDHQKVNAQAEQLNVLHFAEGEDEPELLEISDVETEQKKDATVTSVSFDAGSFSIFGIIGITIEKTVLAADGQNYRISVTYGPETGIPGTAELSVSEILPDEDESSAHNFSYEEYVSFTENALGREAGYIRLFDISIVDKDNAEMKYQPLNGTTVSVKIELADSESESLNVVHFEDEDEVGNIVESSTEGQSVEFSADGFSVYAIVDEAKDPVSRPAVRIQTVEELAQLAQEGQGLYMAHVDGYYFTDGITNITGSRKGITKTAKSSSPDLAQGAVLYYFESVDGAANRYYVYCLSNDNTRKYIRQSGNSMELVNGKENATAFTFDQFPGEVNTFRVAGTGGYYWNMQGGASNTGTSGKSFAAWNSATDPNARIMFQYVEKLDDDPYELNGVTTGIVYDSGSLFCTALMQDSQSAETIVAKDLVKLDTKGYEENLFVPVDSDITEWTFENVREDLYYITTGDGRYLTIADGAVSLSEDPTEIRVIPGSGANKGSYTFSANGCTLTMIGGEGSEDSREFTGSAGGSGKIWFKFAEKSPLSEDDYLVYTAKKISVSDPAEQIVLYTRVWNGTKYDFYVVDFDGSLLRCHDEGDVIKWVGNQYETAVWELTEHTREDDQGNTVPNGYYELKNTYSGKYFKPQLADGSLFSGGEAYLNLDGRYYQEDYTKIRCWDNTYYSYMGLKVDLENHCVVPCPSAQADDFYFARIKTPQVHLTEVETVDNDDYGITMKMIDFNNTIKDQRDSVQTEYFGRDSNNPGLLSTNIAENTGYPVSTHNNTSLGNLFAGGTTANHLFIQSVYEESGYFEFDSTKNFAHLNGSEFEVYDQLATVEREDRPTMYHGQFMPYNSLINPATGEPWPYSEMFTNKTTVTGDPLPEEDSRYGEGLHEIPRAKADYFFGMEMSAKFTQTPNGMDAWDHDIIFEFSGDDDFWFYVDNELVLDLGGVHSAMTGSVNFRTGMVTGRGGEVKSLRQIFTDNYLSRNPDATPADLNQYLGRFFEGEGTVFKPYSTHEMKIFFMERGAGASNLHMRFNLTAVKPGEVTLTKKVTGSDDADYDLMEFPYQILYRRQEDVSADPPVWNELIQNESNPTVTYQGSKRPVKFAGNYTPVAGTEAYSNVFFLKPGEIASITMPSDVIDYKIVECGVNMNIFRSVKANNETLSNEGDTGRKDYETSPASVEDRAEVAFENEVDPDSLRTLTITKVLWDEHGITETEEGKTGTRLYGYGDDATTFDFRVSMSSQDSTDLVLVRNKPYYVKDDQMNYCRWDAQSGRFVSLGIKNYTELAAYISGLSDLERSSIVFETSNSGAVSRIPAGFSVEFRGLPVDSSFKVIERDDEIPEGYKLVDYERDKGSYISGDEPNQGTIRANEDPHVLVNNQRGWGLTVEKIWSDAGYMESHDDIYFAIYIKDKSSGQPELLEGSVRMMSSSTTSLYYYFDELQPDTSFEDYKVYEVILDHPETDADGNIIYDGIHIIGENGILTVGGTPKNKGHQDGFIYTASYETGTPSGGNNNVRKDTVTNTRKGIKLVKTDWNGSELPGAAFMLTDDQGTSVGADSYVSDQDGQITIAYLDPETVYTLTETTAPEGFQKASSPWTITVNSNGIVDVDGDNGSYVVTQATDNDMAVVTIKNKGFSLQALKADESGNPLAGAVFALYRQVPAASGKVKDQYPLQGYEELTTGTNGVIPEITSALTAGVYYLSEVTSPSGYKKLGGDLVFTISSEGTVDIPDNVVSDDADTVVILNNLDGLNVTEWLNSSAADGHVTYTVTVPNELEGVPVRIIKIDQTRAALEGAQFSLMGEGLDLDGLVSKIEQDETDAVIYANEALPTGNYTLTETGAPKGYYPLEGPVSINVVNGKDGVNVTASINGKDIEYPDIEKDQSTGVWTIRLANQTGYELPDSGGHGTRLLYVLGGLLVLGAGLLLVRRRVAG